MNEPNIELRYAVDDGECIIRPPSAGCRPTDDELLDEAARRIARRVGWTDVVTATQPSVAFRTHIVKNDDPTVHPELRQLVFEMNGLDQMSAEERRDAEKTVDEARKAWESVRVSYRPKTSTVPLVDRIAHAKRSAEIAHAERVFAKRVKKLHPCDGKGPDDDHDDYREFFDWEAEFEHEYQPAGIKPYDGWCGPGSGPSRSEQ